MPVQRASGHLRRRSAVAVAIVIGAVGVLAAHDFPALGHAAADHAGLAIGDVAAVCLAVAAPAATAAALWRAGTRAGPAPMFWGPVAEPALRAPVAARAGPPVARVLRL